MSACLQLVCSECLPVCCVIVTKVRVIEGALTVTSFIWVSDVGGVVSAEAASGLDSATDCTNKVNDAIYMLIVLHYQEVLNLGCHEPARTRRDSMICNFTTR